jgi:hypothetical protein
MLVYDVILSSIESRTEVSTCIGVSDIVGEPLHQFIDIMEKFIKEYNFKSF